MAGRSKKTQVFFLLVVIYMYIYYIGSIQIKTPLFYFWSRLEMFKTPHKHTHVCLYMDYNCTKFFMYVLPLDTYKMYEVLVFFFII